MSLILIGLVVVSSVSLVSIPMFRMLFVARDKIRTAEPSLGPY